MITFGRNAPRKLIKIGETIRNIYKITQNKCVFSGGDISFQRLLKL